MRAELSNMLGLFLEVTKKWQKRVSFIISYVLIYSILPFLKRTKWLRLKPRQLDVTIYMYAFGWIKVGKETTYKLADTTEEEKEVQHKLEYNQNMNHFPMRSYKSLIITTIIVVFSRKYVNGMSNVRRHRDNRLPFQSLENCAIFPSFSINRI